MLTVRHADGRGEECTPSEISALPSSPGVYVLLLTVESDRSVTVRGGRTFALSAGLYAYVGSAAGPGGLSARLRRHLRPDKRRHWHVDYLVPEATAVGWLCFANSLQECELARLVGAVDGVAPVPGFGNSDCNCRSHLFSLPPGCGPESLAAAVHPPPAAAASLLPPNTTASHTGAQCRAK